MISTDEYSKRADEVKDALLDDLSNKLSELKEFVFTSGEQATVDYNFDNYAHTLHKIVTELDPTFFAYYFVFTIVIFLFLTVTAYASVSYLIRQSKGGKLGFIGFTLAFVFSILAVATIHFLMIQSIFAGV